MTQPIPFTGSPLNRRSIERRNPSWLTQQLERPESRFLPVWRLQPLVKSGDERSPGWARRELLASIQPTPEPVFLGTHEDIAHFAVDISSLEAPLEALELEGVAGFEDLRGIGAALTPEDASICAQARSLLEWHERNPHCSGCGERTRSAQGGTLRYCGTCDREHFPRTDPVAIAVVVSEDDCLLGRSPGWPENMYSALAGFVEPGESFEETARREIFEEANIQVGRVRYLESQPWPFPSSLMIGCIAEAQTREIRIDTQEIADARWFSRSTLRSALAGDTRELSVPPPVAIAHRLIRAWVDEE